MTVSNKIFRDTFRQAMIVCMGVQSLSPVWRKWPKLPDGVTPSDSPPPKVLIEASRWANMIARAHCQLDRTINVGSGNKQQQTTTPKAPISVPISLTLGYTACSLARG